MPTLQRTAAVLSFPVIAWLGAGCDGVDMPTEPPSRPVMQVYASPTKVVDNDGMASLADCDAVTPTYMTISAAEADAVPNDIIKVCPGQYPEQVFINVNNLTFLGAKAEVDARTRTFVLADESIIDHPCGPVQIVADGVIFDGFTVQGATLNPSVFFACFGAGIWTNPASQGNQGGYNILNNIVQDNIIGMIPASGSTCPETLVQFNLIQNNNFPGPAGGTGIYTDFGLCNATIDKNKFSGHPNASINLAGAAGTQSNIAISNNELVGGTSESIAVSNTTMSSITGNVSIGSTSSGTIDLYGGNSNVTINSNTLFNGVRGIRVDNPYGLGANSMVAAHLNCIDGNSVAGMHVPTGGHSGRLDAENNWWGSPSGPTHPDNPGGNGDVIIDDDDVVDFVPFLKQCNGPPAPSQATGGGQINVSGGRGSFGFNAKLETQSGHLNYINHASGDRLNCTVTVVTFPTTTTAVFSGPCSANSDADSFEAEVEDGGEPGKQNMDKFTITPNGGTPEGGVIRSGNIQIH